MSKKSIVNAEKIGRPAITNRQRTTFLKALREVPNVSRAAAAAGMSRQSAYNIKNSDDEFREAWQAALDEALDKCEEALFERSHTGKSDVASIFLLKHHRPWKYSDKVKVEEKRKVHVVVELYRRDDPRLKAMKENVVDAEDAEVVDEE